MDGLPAAAHNLKVAVATLHTYACGWCAYPPAELIGWLRVFNLARTRFDDERWDALPPRAKGEAIRMAQGEAAA
jgi:hypothetical protein